MEADYLRSFKRKYLEVFGDNVRFTEADYLRCQLPVGVQPSSTASARSIMRTHNTGKGKEKVKKEKG